MTGRGSEFTQQFTQPHTYRRAANLGLAAMDTSLSDTTYGGSSTTVNVADILGNN